ncbi:hypothetical protein JTE90_028652 [Oedothorax gibbosus]|uniref:Uncharacterized protein n=1 Tax=Oedothorax gibbosus TaxID=931172 RepID=A0AAV6UY52_9ARAC|nr:hypothetical protein JTE90_028652 [Oedothorax gibbosus]
MRSASATGPVPQATSASSLAPLEYKHRSSAKTKSFTLIPAEEMKKKMGLVDISILGVFLSLSQVEGKLRTVFQKP